jgi:3-dehydrotetronate 4-kinase
VYQGYLFVGDVLLSESGMRHHPLTPMTDPSLVRVLARQTKHKVGLVPYTTIVQGAGAIRAHFDRLREEGVRHAILDAITDDHLLALGEACADLPLVTGGSGMAMGLPANFVKQGLLARGQQSRLPAIGGPAVVISGSCSTATQAQVAEMKKTHAAFEIDPVAAAAGRDAAAEALAWATPKLGQEPILIYSTAAPEAVSAVQSRHALAGRQGPRDARRAAHRRGRWRDLRRGGKRAGCGRAADRGRDRPGRALDREPGRAATGTGAQVGQFRND